MKKLYTLSLSLLLCGASALAQTPGYKKAPFKHAVPHTAAASSAAKALAKPADATARDLNFQYVPFAYYTPSKDTEAMGEYYFEVSTVEASLDDESNIVYSKEGWGACFDIFSPNTESPYTIPEGTYTPSTSSTKTAYTFDADYTYAKYYAKQGTDCDYFEFDSPVTIKKSGDTTYTVTTTTTRNGVKYNLSFTGEITFTNTNSGSTSTLPAIGHDVVADYTGGMGIYQGDLFQGGTGNMEICLYTTDFDSETGGLTSPGYAIKMSVFNTLFGDSKTAVVKAGEYTPSYKFTRYTYLPGTELTYMGQDMILGSFAQYFDGSTYRYALITEGTCTVEDNGDDTFTVTVDCTTKDGYKVKGTYKGGFTYIDQSSDTPKAHVSNLQDDVQLNLAQIPVARLWKVQNAPNAEGKLFGQYVLDIGSPSGLDQSVADNGGDIFRIQFISTADTEAEIMAEGTYEVMEDRYPASVGEYKLWPGHLYDGDLIGTRYYHFVEGRYFIMDLLAPAAEGSVNVKKNADETYTFTINVIDDAGYKIAGAWTGPVEYQGEAATPDGINTVKRDVQFSFAAPNVISLGGLASSDVVTLYSVDGKTVQRLAAPSRVSLESLPKGVYLLDVAGRKIFKVAKQ